MLSFKVATLGNSVAAPSHHLPSIKAYQEYKEMCPYFNAFFFSELESSCPI